MHHDDGASHYEGEEPHERDHGHDEHRDEAHADH